MRSTILWLILISVTLNSYSQNPVQAKLLKRAYALHSDSLLRVFLNNWSKESRLISRATRTKKTNDTLNNLYQVYNAFYKKDRTAFDKYLLLRDNIQYQVIDSIKPDAAVNERYSRSTLHALEDSLTKYFDQFKVIEPFYAKLDLSASKVLLLTKSYHDLLESFLDTTIETGNYNFNEKTTERAHNDNKVKFIGKYFDIAGRHWGHFFDYMSFPEIRQVMFDRTLSRAIISYELSCKGGVAYLEKMDGKWQIVEEGITITQ